MAYIDPLTGVYNRRYMDAYLDRKILEIADTTKPVSVMMLDLDHFKRVNDTHGHAAGDAVLKELAERVLDNLRDFDMVARYGGEEFVVIMPATPVDSAKAVAERLCGRIAAETFGVPGVAEPLSITVSIGVASSADPGIGAEELLALADGALYEAKRSGRNRTVAAGGESGPPQAQATGGA